MTVSQVRCKMFTISCVSIHIKSGSVFFLVFFCELPCDLYLYRKETLFCNFQLDQLLMNTGRVWPRSILLEHYTVVKHIKGLNAQPN